MRKFLTIILSCFILSSCATKKYGCGLSGNNSSPKKSICRGYGYVQMVDSNVCVIRVKGMIKDETSVAEAKFVLVKGTFTYALKDYKNKVVLFECKPAVNSNFSDIVYANEGCVEGIAENNNSLVNKNQYDTICFNPIANLMPTR